MYDEKNYIIENETTDITKKEDILNGDTVKYVNYQEIESYFDYDFKEEKSFDYSKLNNDELIKLIVDSIIFLINFKVQKEWVFRKGKKE